MPLHILVNDIAHSSKSRQCYFLMTFQHIYMVTILTFICIFHISDLNGARVHQYPDMTSGHMQNMNVRSIHQHPENSSIKDHHRPDKIYEQSNNEGSNIHRRPENISINKQSIKVHQRQNELPRQVQKVCRDLASDKQPNNMESIYLGNIYVDDKHKMMYCRVPKIAGTNWLKILLILSGKMNTSNPGMVDSNLVYHNYASRYLHTLDEYQPGERDMRIKEYYKFMFVRNPLERILSAYRCKLTKVTHGVIDGRVKYMLKYGREIIRRYRTDAGAHSLQTGDDVTFSEFVQYLLDPKTKQPFEEHWKPYHKICHPCLMQYDFIGKYETFDDDVDFVLEELGVANLVNFPNRRNTTRTRTVIKSAYSHISTVQIHKLWELYKIDNSMFNYPYQEY